MHRALKVGAVLAGAVVVSGALGGVANAKSSAVPASTVSFDNCSATFVRSASGIVNETNRVCDPGPQNPWTDAPVYLQFRPLSSTPNPACDPDGLVANPSTAWKNTSPSLDGYFGDGTYNVCVYLVNPVVASGSIDSRSDTGTTVSLPSNLATGRYQIDVSGTWQNSNIDAVDAEYTSPDNWVTVVNGYPGLGEGFGDVEVNQQFVDWGAYSPSQAYSLAVASPGSSINLRVFDGDANSGPDATNAGWYGDNSGSLSFTITYLGQ